MRRKSSKTMHKQGTLAGLEDIYFTQGYKAAKKDFAKHIPEAATGPYFLLKPGQGQDTQRTHTEIQDGISYESFNAPALWDVPYSILQVHFEQVPKEDFIFHSGEEILVPISGEIYYHFYSNNDGNPPQRQVLNEPLRRGSIIRINPQLPHHTWAAGKEGAKAWMIFRHVSDMATSISVNSQFSKADVQSSSRKVTIKDLQEPGKYALIAWGLAERIHLHRVRAKLRIAQLATACGIDSSHLSRIESADTNVSLETLVRIARLLQINLDELIAPHPWCYENALLTRTAGGKRQVSHQAPLKSPSGGPHFLHPIYWQIPGGFSTEATGVDSSVEGVLSSWIVLEGQAIFEIIADSETSNELLEKGSVIHLRRGMPRKIQALQDSQLLQIIYSTECHCNQK
jgi:transcriptional regulator with XRE-family HTH domain